MSQVYPDLGRRGKMEVPELTVGGVFGVPRRVLTDAEIAASVPMIYCNRLQISDLLSYKASDLGRRGKMEVPELAVGDGLRVSLSALADTEIVASVPSIYRNRLQISDLLSYKASDLGRRGRVGVPELAVGDGLGVPRRVLTDAEIAESVSSIPRKRLQISDLLSPEARARCNP